MSMYSDYMDSMTQQERDEQRIEFYTNLENRKNNIRNKLLSKRLTVDDIKNSIDFWELLLQISPVAKYSNGESTENKPFFLYGLHKELNMAINISYDEFVQIYRIAKTDDDLYQYLYDRKF